MQCPSCNAELPFAEDVLAKMKVCPFCSSPMEHKIADVNKKQPETADEYLAAMVDEHGPEIFEVSNLSKLYECLNSWPEKLADERDRIVLLCIKNMPHILYTNREKKRVDLNKVLDELATILKRSFYMDLKAARSLLGRLGKVIFPQIGEGPSTLKAVKKQTKKTACKAAFKKACAKKSK